MKRAVELFALERRPWSSVFVDQTWSTPSAAEKWFMSVAVVHWEMVVTHQRGAGRLTLRGPETKATAVPIPAGAEFFGIQFSLGTFMPGVPPGELVDRALTLPAATPTSFWLNGSAWELPRPHNVDGFVDRLVRDGLVVHDPVASKALRGDVDGLSTRALERRVSQVTGLTRGLIRQVRRAELAVELLSRGVPAVDAARQAGYADQPHLTRSLKRFVGLTPSQIGTSAATTVTPTELPLSFKTTSPAQC